MRLKPHEPQRSAATAYIPNDDISIIRERVLELMIWPPNYNVSVTVQAALLFTETLNSSCYWPDIDYDDLSNVDWQTAIHAYRITTMLQALTVNGSSVKNDSKIRTAVHCALNVWLTRDWRNPSWFFDQVVIPHETSRQLLMQLISKLKRLKKYRFVLPGGYIAEY